MSKKTKRVPHADAVLTDEELDKALEEYDKKYGKTEPAAQTDADDEEVVKTEEVVEQPAPSDDVEATVEAVKARRDKRDEEGDPEDVDAAMGMIAHQDEDIQTLIDLVDTLRARLDMTKAANSDEEEEVPAEEEPTEEVPEEEVQADEVDDLETLKGNEDADDVVEEEIPEDEEEELVTDADEDEEVIPEDEENLDADDTVDEEEEEDLFAEDGEDCEDYTGKRMNADSVERLVNMKIALGELGDRVGIKGLARKPVRDAKVAIIRAAGLKTRMDGRSDVYVNEAFKAARDIIKSRSRKTTADQKRQMYNKKTAHMDSVDGGSAFEARERMIAKYNKDRK